VKTDARRRRQKKPCEESMANLRLLMECGAHYEESYAYQEPIHESTYERSVALQGVDFEVN
jgi:hypothetical protein